jgi:hypothetical protein
MRWCGYPCIKTGFTGEYQNIAAGDLLKLFKIRRFLGGKAV